MANYYDINGNYNAISVKFAALPKVVSITNDNFILSENAATPLESSFQAINLSYDYDSIGRILTLRLASPLKSNTPYRLTVTGLYDSADRLIATEYFDFTTGEVSLTSVLPQSQPTVMIRDRSIRSHAFLTDSSILTFNPDFYIVSSDPEDQDVLVAQDTNNGRMTLVFSQQPSILFVNTQYFKAQRKKVQRAPARWENLSVRVSLDADQPWVYVDFPSTDVSPVYNVTGANYFENGYKYRIKISKNVGI